MTIYKARLGMSARYQLTTRRADESIIRESAWSDNVLTDHMFAMMGGGTLIYLSGAVVGTGNSPALPTDDVLDTFVAARNSRESRTVENQTVNSPRYTRRWVVDRFNAGFVGANPVNLTEVGMAVTSTIVTPNASTLLGSRALIVDSGGSPVAFPVAPDEILDVTWEFTTYAMEDVVVGSIPYDNKGSAETLDAVCRSADMTSGSSAAGEPFGNLNDTASFLMARNESASSVTGGLSNSSALGSYTSNPSPASANAASIQRVGYNPATNTLSMRSVMSLNAGNYVGGGRLFSTPRRAAGGCWQFLFDDPITKTSDDVLEIDWEVEFVRL